MEVFSDYLTSYKTEFGERKLIAEVDSRSRFKSFISESLLSQFLPNPEVFYACVMNSPMNMFASKHKIIMLTLLLLNKWNDEVNSKIGLADNFVLDQFAKRLIEEGTQLGV